jgi:hypothetical protein
MKRSDKHRVRRSKSEWQHVGTFYCLFCGPCPIEGDADGNTVTIHFDAPHPAGYDCAEEQRPQ